ncbi:MAG: hypothetical protein AB1730_07850 [Myxococcota bacterium]
MTEAAATPAAEQKARWPLVEGAVVLVTALWALGFQLWLPSTHVEEADYQAVAQALAAEAQPGDVVLLHPWWTERARIYVPEGLPVVGHLFSDGDDLTSHPRIWVLDQPRLPRGDEAGFEAKFLPSRAEVGSPRRFGNLTLRLFTNGRYRPSVFSARALLPQLSVYLEGPDGARQACPWTGAQHRCPNNKVVSAEWHEVHFEPRPCLRFDAPGGETKLVVELPPQAAADEVVLRTGYTWERGAYKDGVSATDVGLEVDGRVVPLTLPPGFEGSMSARATAVPAGAKVRAWIRAANPNARELCLELDGYGRAP